MEALTNLLKNVSAIFDVSSDEVLGDCRDTRYVDVRHVVCVVAYDRGYNYSEIARFIKMDHSSVQYYVKERPRYDNVQELIQTLTDTERMIKDTARLLAEEPDNNHLKRQMMRLLV